MKYSLETDSDTMNSGIQELIGEIHTQTGWRLHKRTLESGL
jgi:hypothetical protein